MPTWRKLHTKIVESIDLNDMPDDFMRLVWVLLPIGLDREGRCLDNASFIKSKIMPLREDVTLENFNDAMRWFEDRKMIVRYSINGRNYFHVPTFHKYQGKTDREAESNYPKPTPNSVKSRSRVSHDQNKNSSSTDSDVDSDVDLKDIKDSRPSGRTRKPSVKDKTRKATAEYFSSKTGLKVPDPKTIAQKKKAGAMWYAPIREICDLVDWNLTKAKGVIDMTLDRLDGMTVANPNSIIKTSRAIIAEEKIGKGSVRQKEPHEMTDAEFSAYLKDKP
jgi:hypothetical protein